MTAALSASASSVAAELSASTEQISKTLDIRSGAVVQVLGARAEEVAASLGQRTAELADLLDSRTRAMSSTLGERLASMTGELTSRTEELAKLLDERSNAVIVGLGTRAGEVSSELTARTHDLTRLLDEKSSTLVTALDDRTASFATEITRMSDTMVKAVEQRGAAIAESIAASAAGFARTASQSGDELIEALDRIGRSTIGELSTAGDTVKSDLTQVVDRIRDANAMMQQVMTAATRNLENLEGTFTERFKAFRAASDVLNERVVHLEGTTTGILKDVGSLAQRFQDQSKIIASTAGSLDETHRRIDATLDQRREALETLAGNISAYGAEIDQRFKHFADLAREMKAMTEEVRTALDSTRTEMKRGVLELPQETQESAAAMRRVLAEQIKALGDLNDIVARHGHGVDVVEPARRSVEAVAASAGGTRTSTRHEPTRHEPAAEAPVARTAPPRIDTAPPAPSAGSGWLSDLLARASQEEPAALQPKAAAASRQARPPHHAIESLDSLAMDVARMIDHDAAVDLWERYKRGERNVFTRRLYTMQGQQRFEEVRRRYRSDGEFRTTVDRYVEEFERLLDQVARQDGGQVLTKTYLTSDTGKVYTLLAHAAGRFD